MKLDLIDVFGSGALKGNPLGVVHAADGLTSGQMLELTQWLGFSETTFLLPPTEPGADYRVRIFYPAAELPFAGHPTLGSCHAWLQAGGRPGRDGVIVQECGIGLVEIRQSGEQLAFRAPDFIKHGAMDEEEILTACELAGVPRDHVVEGAHVDNGPNWQLLRLRSAEDVLLAEPAARAPVGTDIGLAGPWQKGGEVDWELRAFFTDHQGRFVEDPVTGSFNAGVAVHLFSTGLAAGRYTAAQGQKVGAAGRISCWQEEDGTVWIGGRSTTISSGGELDYIG